MNSENDPKNNEIVNNEGLKLMNNPIFLMNWRKK